MKKTRVFWFHYNKPASAQAKEPRITVHYDNKCYIVKNIMVEVPTHGHLRKSQPFFVIKGKCRDISFKDGVCHVK